jgi:pimeloyl-ACP methyl ester carboxylesterase
MSAGDLASSGALATAARWWGCETVIEMARADRTDFPVIDRVVRPLDGRALAVQEGGDPGGHAVLVQPGMPCSRILYARHLADATERRIRLISYDRPGYGGSSVHRGRSVADCAEDVRAIIDALRIERLAVWGVSAGGPHALACAGLLSDRVVAAATLASCAPIDAEGLDWFAGAGQDNVDDDRLALTDPPAARAKLKRDRDDLLNARAADLALVYPTLFSPVDAAAVTPELIEYNVRRLQAGLAPGIEGWWDDTLATLKPWGFSLERIQVPVMVWHGRHDRAVPFQHGEWLAGHLSNAEAHLSDEDGHVTLGQHRVPAVHDWLLHHF